MSYTGTRAVSDSGINLGKAKVKVEIFDSIKAGGNFADVKTVKSQEFVASSEDCRDALFKNSEIPPFNLDSIIIPGLHKPENDGMFGAILPKAKFYQVHNIMKGFGTGSSEVPSKRIEWVVPSKDVSAKYGAQAGYIANDLATMPWEIGPNYPADYQGARWVTTTVDKMPWDPRDKRVLKTDSSPDDDDEKLDGSGGTTAPPASTTKTIFDLTKMCVAQESVAVNNLFWAIETSGLNLPDNFPFYIDIHRSKRVAQERISFINIRLNASNGATTGNEQFDILIVDGQPPRIYDMTMYYTVKKTIKYNSDMDPSISNSDFLRVGILPVFGRLVVYVNGNYFIYARPNYNLNSGASSGTTTPTSSSPINSFGTVPFKLKTETVQIWGNNCMAKLYMGFMTFPTGQSILPFEANFDDDGVSKKPWESLGKPMPYDEDNTTLGHCAYKFYNQGDEIKDESKDDTKNKTCPTGMGYISVKLKQQTGTENYNYTLAMAGQDATLDVGKVTLKDGYGTDDASTMPYVAPPFLFRLRGVEDMSKIKSFSGSGMFMRPSSRSLSSPRSFYMSSKAGGTGDISEDVISVTRSFTAPDMFHCEQTAEVTIYNNNGKHDALTKKGKCIQISMGWDDPNLVFTGVTMGGSRSEVAGKEILTIHCEDYNRILDDTKVINSPYYDGQETFTAFEDLAKRAGIIPVDDTGDMKFFLPCGYSFTTPKFRVGNYTSIKEALLSVCKPGERCFYFDEKGTLHCSNIQGSLFFTTSYTTVADFYRDPKKLSDGFNVILDERKVDHPVGSVFNEIVIKTIDRTSGAVYLEAEKADKNQNLLLYKKIFFEEMAYLASYEACTQYIKMLKERMFKVPVSVSFTTVTDKAITPLSFIRVDNKDLRVKSVTESLNAEDNSYTTTITADWAGT